MKTQLNGIGFENFKVFKQQQYFDFAPITLLTGTNNSGKSSVINGLRLLNENSQGLTSINQLLSHDFDVNDLIDRYGNLQQFLCKTGNGKESDRLIFSFREHLEGSQKIEISYELAVDKSSPQKTGKIKRVSHRSSDPLNKELISIERIEKMYNNTSESAKPSIQTPFSKPMELDFVSSFHQLQIDFMYFVQEAQKEKSKYDFDPYAIVLIDETLGSFLSELVNAYYGLDSKEAKNAFAQDFVSFLSSVRWRPSTLESPFGSDDYGLNYFLAGEETLLGSRRIHSRNLLLMFIDKFSSISKTIGGEIQYEACLELLEYGTEHLQLFEKVVKPFYHAVIDSLNSNNTLHLSDADTDFDYSLWEKVAEEINRSFPIINDLKKPLFLSANRLENRRVLSATSRTDMNRVLNRISSLEDDSIVWDFVNVWIKSFHICESIRIQYDEETKDYRIYLQNEGHETLLADMGYGTAQLVPILLALVPESRQFYEEESGHRPRVVVIEEPETNLHPALQSKLADLFSEAIANNIQLIIETHSEYLIRKLQYLTARNDSNLKPEDTVIYYFYHPDRIPEGEPQVKKISINDDGSLSDDFGSGFFDEADKIAISILGLQNAAQHN